MGLNISIGVTGVAEVNRTLQIKMDKVQDLRPAWDRIEKLLRAFQKKVFMGKGSATYNAIGESWTTPPWQKLAESTRKFKVNHYPKWADFPLIRTEKLMKAFTDAGSPRGAIRIKDKLLFVYGVDDEELPYAKYHHTGGGHLPKRKVLTIPDNMKRTIVKAIQAHLVKTGQFERETVFG